MLRDKLLAYNKPINCNPLVSNKGYRVKTGRECSKTVDKNIIIEHDYNKLSKMPSADVKITKPIKIGHDKPDRKYEFVNPEELIEESKEDQNSVSYGNESDCKRTSQNDCLFIKLEGNDEEKQNLIIPKELLNLCPMICKPLPDNPPVGMLEAMDDNSISISDDESVSEMSSVPDQDIAKETSQPKIVLQEVQKDEILLEYPNRQIEETKLPDCSTPSPQDGDTSLNEENKTANQKFSNHVGKMQEIKEIDEDEEEHSSQNSPAAKQKNNVDDSEVHSKDQSDEESKNEDENSESEEEKVSVNEDTEFDRANAILLEKAFYSIEEEENPILMETASFGEKDGKELLKCMPSFAKFGLNNNLKSKVEKESVEVKPPKPPVHEIGPEYLSIDSSNNLQSGFFYLAKEDEKVIKKTIILDLPGVLVAFADAKQGGIFSAQCIEFNNAEEDGPKQFVYFWERDQLHWFLGKLRGTHEIILWSSLSRALTNRVVQHIQRENNYFAYVLCKEDCLSFNDRKPSNLVLANATLMMGNKSDQKKCLDMSFSNINKALYPIGALKDLTIFLKSREFDSIFVVDCTENALAYMSKSSSIKIEKFVRAAEDKGFFDPVQQESANNQQSDSDSEKDSSDSDESDKNSENNDNVEYGSLKDLFKTVKSNFS